MGETKKGEIDIKRKRNQLITVKPLIEAGNKIVENPDM